MEHYRVVILKYSNDIPERRMLYIILHFLWLPQCLALSARRPLDSAERIVQEDG